MRSQRGPDGGWWLLREPATLTGADVIRGVGGPLATVRGERPENLAYDGSADSLQEVWIALRANIRGVLERVTLEDLASGKLPKPVLALARQPVAWTSGSCFRRDRRGEPTVRRPGGSRTCVRGFAGRRRCRSPTPLRISAARSASAASCPSISPAIGSPRHSARRSQVQAWMGHADIGTTMRYLHSKSRPEDAALLGAAFASRKRPS